MDFIKLDKLENELFEIKKNIISSNNETTNLINSLTNPNRILPKSEISSDVDKNQIKVHNLIKDYKAKLLEMYTLINE